MTGMAFSTDGIRVYATYFTSSSHILLGLQFSSSPVGRPAIVKRPAIGRSTCGPLNESRIVEAVLSGVANVSSELGVSEIVYVADDSPNYGLYERAATELAKRHLIPTTPATSLRSP